MARQIIVIALISLAAFAAVVSAQSPASAPSKSTAVPTAAPKSSPVPSAAPKSAPVPSAAVPMAAAPKSAATNATGAGIADDETDPPIPSDEPAESPADSPDASDDGSSTNSSDLTLPAAGSAASLEFSAAVGATAAAGFFFM